MEFVDMEFLALGIRAALLEQAGALAVTINTAAT